MSAIAARPPPAHAGEFAVAPPAYFAPFLMHLAVMDVARAGVHGGLCIRPHLPNRSMHDAPRSAAGYRPDIDGLRGLAILAVILFHAGVRGCGGGFVGVDVFFVISGYLIATQILRDLDAGTFSLVQFWTRRARRIVPALALVVTVCLIVGWFLMFPGNYRDLGQSALAQSCFVSNVFFRIKAGYFTAAAETKPLLHTWSLSIEEQFYIVIPVLLWLAAQWGRPGVVAILVACGLGSFVVGLRLSTLDPEAAFYLMPSRAWELAVGCLLATLPARPSPGGASPLREAVALAGLASVAAAAVVASPAGPWPGALALVPCLGAAAVIAANSGGETRVGRLLSAPPLVAIGLVSYSLYLWHWPFLAFARYASVGPLHPAAAVGAAALAVPVAWASYRFIEQPCRRADICRRPLVVLPVAAVLLAVQAAAGAAIYVTDGLRTRAGFAAGAFEADVTAALDRDAAGTAIESATLRPGLVCRLGDVTNDRPKLLLVGDSFADMYLGVFCDLSRTFDREVWFLQERRAPLQTAVPAIVRSGLVGDVVIACSWRRAVQGGLPELAQPERAAAGAAWSRSLGFDPAALLRDRRGEFRADFTSFVESLTAAGCRVWVVDAPPYFPVSVPLKLGLLVGRGDDPARFGTSLPEQRRLLAPVHDVFATLAARHLVTVLRPTDVLCDGAGFCAGWADGHALASDDAHLSAAGAARVAEIFTAPFQLPSQ